MIKVLFVCLGNICRSPLAEAVFNDLVKKRRLQKVIEVDSAGTAGYHIGNDPDPRTLDCARAHNIPLKHKARQFSVNDLQSFDYLLAMDRENLRHIINTGGELNVNTFLMRHFDPVGKDGDVPDPYYGGREGFEEVFRILERSSLNLLTFLTEKHQIGPNG